MELKGINDNQMTIAAGLSVGLLGKLKKNGKGMNSVNIEKILYSYPDLNAEWLLTGEGEMLKASIPSTNDTSCDEKKEIGVEKNEEIQRQSEKNCDYSSHIHKLPEGCTEGIPLIPASAMAGAFTSDISVMEYECEHYIIPDFKGADFLIRVKGDSMQSTYYSGDLVACQKISMNDIFFQWNKTYVLDTDQGPLIKRVLPSQNNNSILIVSDNENYPPFELDKSQLHAIALVRGIIRLE